MISSRGRCEPGGWTAQQLLRGTDEELFSCWFSGSMNEGEKTSGLGGSIKEM